MRPLALLLCAALCGFADGGRSLSLPLHRRRSTVSVQTLRARALLAQQAPPAPSADVVTAQLPLDANAWGQGVFTTTVQLGTPPQSFDVVVDTGSVLLWVACGGCGVGCDAPQPRPGFAQGAFFNTTASSSFRAVPCLSRDCVTDTCAGSASVIAAEGNATFGTQPLVAASALGASGLGSAMCGYFDLYADGSSSVGTLANDVLALGSITTPVLFGCETAATGNTWSEQLDGIMGMGLGDQSVITQLTTGGDGGASGMADAFALCLGPIGAEYTYSPVPMPWQTGADAADAAASGGTPVGALVLGELALHAAEQSAVLWSPLVRSLSCWTTYLVSVTSVSVGGTDIAAYSELTQLEMQAQYAQRCGGTIIDSGSSFMYLPGAALSALTAAITAQLAPGAVTGDCPGAAQLGGNATCYAVPMSASRNVNAYFPVLTVALGGGAQLQVGPENYLFALGAGWPGLYVLGVYNSGGEGAVLGAITLANTLVVFDRANARVGFRNGTTDCAAFAAGAGAVPEPPPAPRGRVPLPADPLPIGAVFVVPFGAQVLLLGGAAFGFFLGWLFEC